MYKGEVGIDNLNINLQSIFNPYDNNKKEIKLKDGITTLKKIEEIGNNRLLHKINVPRIHIHGTPDNQIV